VPNLSRPLVCWLWIGVPAPLGNGAAHEGSRNGCFKEPPSERGTPKVLSPEMPPRTSQCETKRSRERKAKRRAAERRNRRQRTERRKGRQRQSQNDKGTTDGTSNGNGKAVAALPIARYQAVASCSLSSRMSPLHGLVTYAMHTSDVYMRESQLSCRVTKAINTDDAHPAGHASDC